MAVPEWLLRVGEVHRRGARLLFLQLRFERGDFFHALDDERVFVRVMRLEGGEFRAGLAQGFGGGRVAGEFGADAVELGGDAVEFHAGGVVMGVHFFLEPHEGVRLGVRAEKLPGGGVFRHLPVDALEFDLVVVELALDDLADIAAFLRLDLAREIDDLLRPDFGEGDGGLGADVAGDRHGDEIRELVLLDDDEVLEHPG